MSLIRYPKDIAKKHVLNKTTLIERDIDNKELLKFVLDRDLCGDELYFSKYHGLSGNGILEVRCPSIIKLSQIIS